MRKVKIHVWGILRLAILFGILVFLWWYFRTYELFLMLIAVAGTTVASICLFLRSMDLFSAQATLPVGGIGMGSTVPMSVRVTNAGRFLGFAADLTYVVRNVFTEYETKKKVRIWLAPGTKVVVEKELMSRHVGRVEALVTEMTVWDWLGICSVQRTAFRNAGVIVAPHVERVDGEELAASVEDFPNENETKKRGMDVNPDYEIREYVPGDDLKSIHWKLTAKTGRTMVRERLATGRDKINVLLALSKDESENDGLIASLHGLGLMLLDKGYPVRLCWLGYGGILQGRYFAEEGELENALDEILSVSGKQDPEKAKAAMETEFPGEAYVLVKNGAYKGTYVR